MTFPATFYADHGARPSFLSLRNTILQILTPSMQIPSLSFLMCNSLLSISTVTVPQSHTHSSARQRGGRTHTSISNSKLWGKSAARTKPRLCYTFSFALRTLDRGRGDGGGVRAVDRTKATVLAVGRGGRRGGRGDGRICVCECMEKNV